MNMRALIFATPFLFSSMVTQAEVFTYQVSSNYAFGGGGVLGSSAIIDLSFDNGGTSNLNQSYTFANLTDISVSTVGGSFLLNDNISSPGLTSYSSGFIPTTVLVSTNSTGNGTLLLPTSPNQFVHYTDPTVTNEILKVSMGSDDSIYLISTSPGYSQAQIYNSHGPVTLSATYLPAAVPVPAALWMFMVGLGCVLYTWRASRTTKADIRVH